MIEGMKGWIEVIRLDNEFGNLFAYSGFALSPGTSLHILMADIDDRIPALMVHIFWIFSNHAVIEEVCLGFLCFFKEIPEHGHIEGFTKSPGPWDECHVVSIDDLLYQEGFVYKVSITVS